MLEAPFKKLVFQLVGKRLNGLFFSPGNLREDVFRCVVTSVFKTGGVFLRSCCVYVLVDSEQLGISEYPVRVLALNRVHLQLLSHVEGVVDGNTLGFFFFHVDDKVLTVDRVSDWVLDEHLVAANRSVAGVDKHIFVILFPVLIRLPRVGRVVE